MERVNRRRKPCPAILRIYFLIIQDSNWPRLGISAAGALAMSRDVRFSNRPTEVKRFQTIRRHGVDVARGLALLFGIGTTALPSWDSRIRRNNRPARDIIPPLASRRRTGGSQASTLPHSHSLPSSPRSNHRPPAFGSMTISLIGDFVDAVALERPARHACGEDMKCAIGRGRHLDALADGGTGDGPVHFPSLSLLAPSLSTSA
jgi:hypothetical protein